MKCKKCKAKLVLVRCKECEGSGVELCGTALLPCAYCEGNAQRYICITCNPVIVGDYSYGS